MSDVEGICVEIKHCLIKKNSEKSFETDAITDNRLLYVVDSSKMTT